MFGSHLSIAGGFHNALLDAERLGLETVQLFTANPRQLAVGRMIAHFFTKNQQQWHANPLASDAVALFRQHAARLGFTQIVAHDSYLINLAAVDPALRDKSIAAFSREIDRCNQLGIAYLVTHPGAHCGQGEDIGLEKIIAAYNQIMQEHPGPGVTVCIETTAGQGSCLGCTFEHIARILKGVARPERFGVCLDTCHVLAAGYDIRTARGTTKMLDDFDRRIGLDHLKVFHFNDSKKPLGSRVDRHTHIGHGHVGLAAFRTIVRDPRFKQIPKILETPKEKAPDGRDWDAINLEVLWNLARGKKVALTTPVVVQTSKPVPATHARHAKSKPPR
jgi:deoxyribonuclease IV